MRMIRGKLSEKDKQRKESCWVDEQGREVVSLHKLKDAIPRLDKLKVDNDAGRLDKQHQ